MIRYWYNADKTQLLRKSRYDIVNVEIDSIKREVKSFKEECKLTAQEIAESNSNINLGLTGGWHSQIILQSFLDIGIKPQIFIVSLPLQLNKFDVTVATNVCNKYSLSYNLINISESELGNDRIFNFTKENKDWSLVSEVQLYHYFDLLMGRVFNKLNDTIIIGNNLNFRRDVHPEAQWSFILDEGTDFWIKRYNEKYNRKIIHDFFTRNSELLYSFITDFNTQSLFKNSTSGKISIISSRNLIYKNHQFVKDGPFNKTTSYTNIQNLTDSKNDLILNHLGFKNRFFYMDIDKLESSLKTENTIWKYV